MPLCKRGISSIFPGSRPLPQGHGHSVRTSWVLVPMEETKKVALVPESPAKKWGVVAEIPEASVAGNSRGRPCVGVRDKGGHRVRRRNHKKEDF